MFTPTSRKPVLAFSVLLTAGILYACFIVAFNSLSTWAERDLDAYPFKQEDWLRYLLPSRFSQPDKKRLLLTGPSTVRENLLYEEFEQAFPQYVVIQGGLSLGTLDDVTASLHFLEMAYGEQALPRLLVLGISPRFIANIPDERPFADGIDNYSPDLSASQGETGIQLAPRHFPASLYATVKFLIRKQPERYRTTMMAIAYYWIAGNPSATRGDDGKTFLQRELDKLFKHPAIARYLGNTRYKRALDYDFTEVLAWFSSPYKYRLDPPIEVQGLVDWMDEPDSWWQDVHGWDPRATADRTEASLKRFYAVIQAHDIRLIVVNMPERAISRARYDSENYAAYLQMVSRQLGNAPVLDLQTFLNDDEFHDLEHSVYRGSRRLTSEIIETVIKTDR